MMDSRLTRRHFLLATGAVAATGLLVACESDDDAADDQPTDDTDTGTVTDDSDADDSAEVESDDDEPVDDDPDDVEGEETDDDDDVADGDVQTGGTLHIGQDFGPQDLDPTISSAWASTNIQELIYTALMRWDKDMEMEPDLATDWEIVDDQTYVFNLRDDVVFHNGKEFTAEDVVFTFERILDPDVGSPRISLFNAIESIEADGDYTVQFNLSTPSASLIRFLATIPHGAIVPSNATDEELNSEAPGTGPFRFVDHVLDQEVQLEAFEDYYEEGLPYLDEVRFRLLGDDTSISSALTSQSVQITWLKNPTVAENVAETTEGLVSVPGVSSRYFPIHFKLDEPPFDDVNVRRAMSLALDRESILNSVLGGHGSVGTFLPPSQLAGYDGDGSGLPYYQQDIDEARNLLAEAGYDQLDIPEYKVVAANQLDVQCAQVMQSQWAEAGINVEINPMEVGAILDDWGSGNYSMASVAPVWQPDPDQEVRNFYSQSPFGTGIGINDSELDELIEQAAAEVDEETRVELYHQIQEHILDQVYIIVPYAYPLRWELVWDFVHGYEVMASNARLYVRETWLSEQ
jgi:peptide/nickel transport system substrate-binding protein